MTAVARLVAGLALLTQGGCMSALTSASLREVVLDTVESLAEAAGGEPSGSGRDADVSSQLATDDRVEDDVTPAESDPSPPSLDEAIARAAARLRDAGALDAETRATLLSILEATKPEDWSAAIDAFTASLATHRPPRQPAGLLPDAAAVESGDGLVFPASADSQPTPAVREPVLESAVESPARVATEPAMLAVVATARPAVPETAPDVAPPAGVVLPASQPVIGAEEPIEIDAPREVNPAPAAPPAEFAVRNPCFVSRVQAWGVVDRFPEAAFQPGQDVIVYFELDAPLSRGSAAGHFTSIDTAFRLVGADGRELQRWTFEPLTETCHAPRRDYFARYFLRIPESAPRGPCRLEFTVTDLVGGASTQAHLDLDVR